MQANSVHELVAVLEGDVDRWVLLKAALRLIPEQRLSSPITVGPKCGKAGANPEWAALAAYDDWKGATDAED